MWRFKKLNLQTKVTVGVDPGMDCQYVESIDYHNPSGSDSQPIAFNGNYCAGGTFNFDRTLTPSQTGSISIEACIDMNSLSYTPSYVTINFDPMGICE